MRKRRRKNITKANSLLRHSKRRASERYGLNIGRAGLRVIVDSIRSGNAMFIRRESNRISEWKVEYQGVEMRVIYDKRRSMVVTFLPPRGRCEEGEIDIVADPQPMPQSGGDFWERESALAAEE